MKSFRLFFLSCFMMLGSLIPGIPRRLNVSDYFFQGKGNWVYYFSVYDSYERKTIFILVPHLNRVLFLEDDLDKYYRFPTFEDAKRFVEDYIPDLTLLPYPETVKSKSPRYQQIVCPCNSNNMVDHISWKKWIKHELFTE